MDGWSEESFPRDRKQALDQPSSTSDVSYKTRKPNQTLQTVYIPDITRSSNQKLIKLRFNQPLDSIKDALKANSTVLSWITHYSNNVFASSFCPEGKKASRTLERKSRRKELPWCGMS